MADLMGFQGEAFIGTAGTTGDTRLTGSRDINYAIDTEMGNTTRRGDSSSPPIQTEEVTLIVISSITIQMVNDTADAALATIRVAASSAGKISLRLKDYSSGKGFDGDVTLSMSNPYPLNGEQVIEFTAKPSRFPRVPQTYV
jgi:hypothetical protein